MQRPSRNWQYSETRERSVMPLNEPDARQSNTLPCNRRGLIEPFQCNLKPEQLREGKIKGNADHRPALADVEHIDNGHPPDDWCLETKFCAD